LRTPGAAHYAGGNQAVEEVRRLGAGAQGRLSTMVAPEKFVQWMKGRYPKAKI